MPTSRTRRMATCASGTSTSSSCATGRRYQIDTGALDEKSLQDLLRLLRDLDGERRAAVQRARLFPWRR